MALTNTAPGDERLFIQFDTQPVINPEKSKAEGRPIYDEVEFIKIAVPGDRDNIVHRPLWNEPTNVNSDTRRFARQYADWKSGRAETAPSGTPLSAWPVVTKAQVEEMKHFHVHTVEQLADLADSLAQGHMGIQSLKQKAKDFLLAAKSAAPLEQMRAELEARDAQLATQAKQIKELGDMVADLRAKQPAAPTKR